MDSDDRLRRTLEREIRSIGRRWTGLPTVLTKERAARELSITRRKLEDLITAGAVWTCEIAGEQRVPRSEIERLAQAKPPARVLPFKKGRLGRR